MDIVIDCGTTGSTSANYVSLLRWWDKHGEKYVLDTEKMPKDKQIAQAALAYACTHKMTSFPNLLCAIGSRLKRTVRIGPRTKRALRGLKKLAGRNAVTRHKTPLQLKHLRKIKRCQRRRGRSPRRNPLWQGALVQCRAALRIKELLKLRVRDVRITAAGAYVKVSNAKNHAHSKTTVVPRESDCCAVKALERACRGKDGRDRVFEFGRGTYNAALRRWARKACGLRATSHSLRAGWTTDAFLREVPLHIVVMHGRWGSAEAVRHYNHPDDEDRLAQELHLRRL